MDIIKTNTRKSVLSGTWYPKDKIDLRQNILNRFCDETTKKYSHSKIKALIVPHAGYNFSGDVAAKTYCCLKNHYFKKAIILAPSHNKHFKGASISSKKYYKTPLGKIKISTNKRNELLKNELFKSYDIAHKFEHSIEIQIPFLQTINPNIEILPILIGGDNTSESINEMAKIIEQVDDHETIFIISSDFTHYGIDFGYIPFYENLQENIARLDNNAIEIIKEKDSDEFNDYISLTQATICGKDAITILLKILKKSKYTANLIDYDISLNKTIDPNNSVSYVGMVFSDLKESDKNKLPSYYESLNHISRDHKDFAINLVRENLIHYLNHKKPIKVDQNIIPGSLKNKKACFITYKINNSLKGCIGSIIPKYELYEEIINNSINAAFYDPRFEKLTESDLNHILVEISVLTEPIKLNYNDEMDLLNQINQNDGLMIKSNLSQSTFLPQVWEQIPTKELFLDELALKAGLNKNAWKTNNVELYKYQVETFSQKLFE